MSLKKVKVVKPKNPADYKYKRQAEEAEEATTEQVMEEDNQDPDPEPEDADDCSDPLEDENGQEKMVEEEEEKDQSIVDQLLDNAEADDLEDERNAREVSRDKEKNLIRSKLSQFSAKSGFQITDRSKPKDRDTSVKSKTSIIIPKKALNCVKNVVQPQRIAKPGPNQPSGLKIRSKRQSLIQWNSTPIVCEVNEEGRPSVMEAEISLDPNWCEEKISMVKSATKGDKIGTIDCIKASKKEGDNWIVKQLILGVKSERSYKKKDTKEEVPWVTWIEQSIVRWDKSSSSWVLSQDCSKLFKMSEKWILILEVVNSAKAEIADAFQPLFNSSEIKAMKA